MATVVLDPQHPAHALKAMRAEKALSLRALSVKTGMPFSTLSKLENGKIALTYAGPAGAGARCRCRRLDRRSAGHAAGPDRPA